MNLTELQSKSDQELLDTAVEVGAVEKGATLRRMELLRKMFKIWISLFLKFLSQGEIIWAKSPSF